MSAAGICLVVVITLLSSSGGSATKPVVVSVKDDQAPPRPGGSRPAPAGEKASVSKVVEAATRADISIINKATDQLETRFLADEINPRPQFEIDVKRPEFQYFMSPTRVLRIVGEHGVFYAPDNKPQRGRFTGLTVVTIYEAGRGERLDLGDESPHRVARIDLSEGATFDATQGRVVSEGPVRMVTLRENPAELKGRGLQMVYNNLAEPKRIDYLEVTDTEFLRFSGAGGRSRGEGARDETRPGGEKESAGAAARARGSQFYLSRFERPVRLTTDTETLDAEHLDAYLSLEGSGGSSPEASRSNPEASRAGDGVATPPARDARDRPSSPVTITGGGKLVMRPVDKPPQVERPTDRYIVFRGDALPVRITSKDDTKITAATVEYLDSMSLITMKGSDVHPLRIHSPQMGRLAGERMFVRLDKHVAQLEGPGTIRAPLVGVAPASGRGGLPPGFAIIWSNSVNIDFEPGAGSQNPLMRSATFIGAVHVTQPEPRFDLQAEQVTAGFEPDKTKGEGKRDSRLNKIDAVGNVVVDSEQGAAQADKLHMDMVRGPGGQAAPSLLRASGSAGFASSSGAVAGEYIEVTFLPPQMTPRRQTPRDLYMWQSDRVPYAPRAPVVLLADAVRGKKSHPAATPRRGRDAGSDRFGSQVATMTALRKVYLKRGATEAYCDRLDADNVKGLATLLGTASTPVVVKGKGELKGEPFEMRVQRLDLDRVKQTSFADGAGWLTFAQKGTQEDPARPVTVTWTRKMTFDDTAGLVQFFGDVKAVERPSPTRVQTISSPQMTLELVDPKVVAAVNGVDAKTPVSAHAGGGGDLLDSNLSGRQLRKFTARDGVVLTAVETNADNGDEVLRFRLEGGRLDYTAGEGLAEIPGPGHMIVIDKRPSSRSDASKSAEVSGRGHTGFEWKDGASFDNINHTMVMRGEVTMTHDPLGGQELILLDTDELSAVMKDPESVQIVGMHVGSLNAQSIDATGRVRIRKGPQEIRAHKMHYDGSKDTVEFRERQGRKVEITNQQTGRREEAEIINWNLATGRIEAVKPGKRF